MNKQEYMQRDRDYVLGTYGRSPVVLEKGEGMYAWDTDGRQYLDLTSGIGVNSLGFSHPAWVEAVQKQAAQLAHISNLYYTLPCSELAEKIVKRTGLSKVFFGNSGAEANEGLIKAARKYATTTYGPERNVVVSLNNSFHGRTLATLTATGQDVFHHDFGPFNDGFMYAPANDLNTLKEICENNPVCAVLMEPVQGEGGVMMLDPAFVQEAAAWLREKDILLLFDEVQTGIGRTGTFLACEQLGVTPDGVSLAKGLGGGLPIGAVVLNEKMAAPMGPSSHGSTFGGNPVACAGANVVVDTLTEDFLAQVRKNAALLREQLAGMKHVKSITGLGLMVGIEFDEDVKAADVRRLCEEKGLLVLTAKTKLRLLPPLIISEKEISEAMTVLREVLENL
ncbi:MAG: aspartate aminotransferase family protein [Lachnospiraceae bacterium]|nr:aspartate aminotransferase family protein [Lachnospiraceae bacterium]